MYDGPGMSEPTDEDNDDDLEHSEEEIKDHFEKFWYDIVPEFRRYGKIEQMRVCRNHSHHLRGNVYVMYKREEDAVRAFQAFQGRFYAGRQLFVQYSPLVNWKTAVCGLFTRQRCERGKQCNFLHVFKNPNGELEGREAETESRDRRGRDDRKERRDGGRDRKDKPDRPDRPEKSERPDRRQDRDRPRDRNRDRDRDRDRRAPRDNRDQHKERDTHAREHNEPRDEKRPLSGSPGTSRSPSPDRKRARVEEDK